MLTTLIKPVCLVSVLCPTCVCIVFILCLAYVSLVSSILCLSDVFVWCLIVSVWCMSSVCCLMSVLVSV